MPPNSASGATHHEAQVRSILEEWKDAGVEAGRRVVLGLRPHRLRLGGDAAKGVVVSNQWLGNQAHVAIEAAGHMLIAVHPTHVTARVDETVGFDFDPADLHVFDETSGVALVHGGIA